VSQPRTEKKGSVHPEAITHKAKKREEEEGPSYLGIEKNRYGDTAALDGRERVARERERTDRPKSLLTTDILPRVAKWLEKKER